MGSELVHHGVKGMHWGQRKAQIKSAGTSAGKAVEKGISYVGHHQKMVAGGVILARVLYVVGSMAIHAGKTGILFKAAKNREAAYKAGKIAVRALSSSAAKINYAKMVRGAYKITTL